ncbi:hypothetical protein QQS21_003822 [Conoideocrella luteorostrata]|uniref:Aminoglycoside phosphotransferase domain-containing protein n=1 Tax=Conoideocrella luteorostrata TaxID=1105319 RepID=A0AAJ0G0A5_9HYPO|nr:hypothetical protein QQS21_003822 [Conoideocrella luteorostrata]
MPEISSDTDLPKLLDTPTKQVKWAKSLVTKHLGSAAKRVDKPPMQGMFSRTLFLTLADGRETVIQFRTEPLDLDAFKIAKKALGSVVPDARALEDEELLREQIWAYCLSRLHGKMWIRGVAGKGAEGRIAINRSLGQVFSKGCLAASSGETVNNTIRPHLEAILASPLEELIPYKHYCQGFLDQLEELGKLPLWVAHYDLNELNVLIDENCHVTGWIDWELSTPRPFGVGFGRIHTLAGEYTGGEFWMPDEFEVAERTFWNELFEGMPVDTATILKTEIALVQEAVILGTLLDCFFFENGKVGFSKVALKALPKFLTYRIPFVRGNEAPYRC